MTISKQGNCHPERPQGVEGSLRSNQISDSSASLGMTCIDSLQGPHSPAQLDSIELIPVVIENYSTPRLATDEEAKKILEKIGQTEKNLK